jgi:hypothetical protein
MIAEIMALAVCVGLFVGSITAIARSRRRMSRSLNEIRALRKGAEAVLDEAMAMAERNERVGKSMAITTAAAMEVARRTALLGFVMGNGLPAYTVLDWCTPIIFLPEGEEVEIQLGYRIVKEGERERS